MAADLNRYLDLNQSFDSPFIFKLTRRGFYSEVNNLLNAVLFGLAKRRRLIVDETEFEGQRWADFFTATLPTAPPSLIRSIPREWTIDGATHAGFAAVRRWVAQRHRRFPLLWLPGVGPGSVFQLKRSMARILTTSRAAHELPVGLQRPFAAFHIRRGDKVDGYAYNGNLVREGDHIAAAAYIDFLDRCAPNVRHIFVMADDYRSVEEVRAAASGRPVVSLCTTSELGYYQNEFTGRNAAQKKESLNRLIAEADIAAQSSLFIGGFKSNVARFIPLWHRQPRRCYSIDGMSRWSPE